MSRYTDANTSPVLKPLPGVVTGIGANQTATFRLPVGLTFADLMIRFRIGAGAPTRAQLETMLGTARFTVSGVEKFSITVKQLIAIAEFYRTGIVGDTGILVIPFQRLWMDGVTAKLDPNYGTDGESSVILEIQQGAGSTIDGIECFTRINPKAERLGSHVIMRRFTINMPAVGKNLFTDLPILAGEFLNALHIECPTPANLTNIAYVPDDNRQIDLRPDVLNQLYLECNPVRTPQTAKGFVHLDFTMRGFDSDALPTHLLSSQVLELDWSVAPGAVTIIGEYQTLAR